MAIAICLGIAAGLVLPTWALRAFATFNAVFSQFLGFMIPLIIVGLVTPAIADLGRGGGRMLAITVAMAYGATILAGLMSYGISAGIFPLLVSPRDVGAGTGEAAALAPYFSLSIPPPMDVMTALALSFTVGLGIACGGADGLHRVCGDLRTVVERAIGSVLIPLLPLYILGIFMDMAASGEVARVIGVFASIVAVIFAMHIAWLLFLYAIAGGVAGRNPLRLLATMMPAYLTALGTQSSAATIPVTLRQTLANGVREEIAGFTIPLCATIHLSGSMLKIVSCSVALMLMQGMPYDFGLFLGFICMLGITMVAAPGVPGGAIMAALGVLASMLGFTEPDLALMIAIYIAMDCLGTACNVTGDGAIAIIMQRLFPGK